ncbi:uncharacterized protein LOC121879395 isoform X2 [Homarus americanus]|nr:uncharacterized protein LOC121879395 isoform X2 [Homarus americanus]
MTFLPVLIIKEPTYCVSLLADRCSRVQVTRWLGQMCILLGSWHLTTQRHTQHLIDPTASYGILRHPTTSCESPREPTTSCCILQDPTKAYDMLQYSETSYDILRYPTTSYDILFCPMTAPRLARYRVPTWQGP